MSQSHSLESLCVLTCPTAAYLVAIIPGVLQMLTDMAMLSPTCPTCPISDPRGRSLSSQVSQVTFWSGSLLSHLSHCCSLGWPHFIPAVPLPLTDVAVLSQVCHCHSLGWPSVVSGVPYLHMEVGLHCPRYQLKLSDVVLHYLKCPTFPHWGGFMLPTMSHWCRLEWLCITSDVHCCSEDGSVSSQRYQSCLLRSPQ